MSLGLELATRISQAGRQYGSAQHYMPLTVVVLDSGGHIVSVDREDGSSIGRVEVAFGKAYGALALGVGSRALMARAEAQSYFIGTVASALDGRLVPVPGGVLVRAEDGTLLGAVGVSGDASDNDERVAVAGIEAVGLRPQVD